MAIIGFVWVKIFELIFKVVRWLARNVKQRLPDRFQRHIGMRRNLDGKAINSILCHEAIKTILIILSIPSFLMLVFAAFYAPSALKSIQKGDTLLLSILSVSAIILLLAYFSFRIASFKEKVKSAKNEYTRLGVSLQTKFEEKEKQQNIDYQRKLSELEKRESKIKSVLQSETPFKHAALMAADFESILFDDVARKLTYKKHPARSAAQEVKEIKKLHKSSLRILKEMQYKQDFLISVFPELEQYIEDDQSLLHVSSYESYDSFKSDRDRVADWLSPEEYKTLSIHQRNQLALDRYKLRNKSKWEIGMEYELYIGYLLRKESLEVIQYGIEKGLSDLGRDIIAQKRNKAGTEIIYIIQCKRWSTNKELHENVICQLFGTSMEYQIKNQHMNRSQIVPMLVTTAPLSEMAKEFARRLGVSVKTIQMGEYPMIKCNIDSMIYHLPFDQQYYTTKIEENKGEFYAWTVKEAVDKGYRRAMKYYNLNQ